MSYRAISILSLAAVLFGGVICPGISGLASAQGEKQDLMTMSIEELLDLEIISVTRGKGQSIRNAPAAIFVVTADDIKRIGATSIAEALRIVPGLHVARQDAGQWGISSRGGTTRWYSYMLVQVDGRTVYSPTFSGVLWEAQDIPLEDIERIEVIRGPGAALWGANAVNGIINIVTKPAKDTKGGLVSGTVGTEDRFIGNFRYGTGIEDFLDFRVYGKYRTHDDFATYGTEYTDDWYGLATGFRADIYPLEDDVLTLGMGYHEGQYGSSAQFPRLDQGIMERVPADFLVDDWHALAQWRHSFSETSELQAQVFYDWMSYNTAPRSGNDLDLLVEHGTTDVDVQHSVQIGERHNLVYGAEYRNVDMNLPSSNAVFFEEEDVHLDTYSGFVQDTVSLIPEELSVTLGTKVEENDLTGFEYQPTARAAWSPHENHTVWASWSRAVREPSVFERDVSLIFDIFQLAIVNPTPFGPPVFVIPIPLTMAGSGDLDAVTLNAYEVGYRTALSENLSLDVAGYFNHYDDPIGLDILMVGGMPAGLKFRNLDSAETYGVELATTWQALDCLKLTGGYTFMDMDDDDSGFMSTFPEHQVNVTSKMNITEDVDFNVACYYYDELVNQAAEVNIPEYVRLDVGVSWRPLENLELSVWGQNLLDDQHPEIVPDFGPQAGAAEVERGVYAMATLRF